jgi:hypothetical protein
MDLQATRKRTGGGEGDTREIKLTTLPRRAKNYCVISIEMIAVSISEGEIVHSDHSEASLLLLLSQMPSAEVTRRPIASIFSRDQFIPQKWKYPLFSRYMVTSHVNIGG